MSIQRIILAAALSAAFMPCIPALGQMSREDVSEEISTAISDPSLSSPVTAGRPQVTLTSNKENSNLVGEFGIKLPGEWTWSLRLQAPVESGQEEVELATLEGLGSGAVATMGFTKVFFQVANPDGIFKICDQLNSTLSPREPINIDNKECTIKELSAPRDTAGQQIVRQVTRQVSLAFCDEINRNGQHDNFLLQEGVDFTGAPPNGFEDCETFLAEKRKSKDDADRQLIAELDKKIEENLLPACREYNKALPSGWIDVGVNCQLSDLKKRPDGDALKEKALKEIGLTSPKFLSIKVSASNKTFKFAKDVMVDGVPTIEEAKESKDSYSGTASFGVLHRGFYYGANAIFERIYKGAPASQICRPLPNRPGDICSNLALKGPQRTDQDIFQVELRRFFSDHLGINAKVSYEAQEKVEGYQLLIYLLQSKDKGLNGGLDFGYRSDNKDFTVRAFIGMALKIVPDSV
jgi:hypothetical protein